MTKKNSNSLRDAIQKTLMTIHDNEYSLLSARRRNQRFIKANIKRLRARLAGLEEEEKNL